MPQSHETIHVTVPCGADDPRARVVHIFTEPSADGYGSCQQVTTESLRPPVWGGPDIDIEALFALLD
jgi:hypothetical protein